MRLYLEELETELSQRIKPNKNTQVLFIRPHLYLHNIPSGSVKVQICSTDGVLIAESDPLLFSAITASNEYHGYVSFEVKANLQKDVFYTVKIVALGGYSFNEFSYCAVCRDLGFKKYPYSTPVSSALNTPLDLEIWSQSRS